MLSIAERVGLARRRVPAPTPAMQQQSFDLRGNLDVQSGLVQESNRERFNLQRRQAPSKGVEVKKAF